jgi:hypothetical protein
MREILYLASIYWDKIFGKPLFLDNLFVSSTDQELEINEDFSDEILNIPKLSSKISKYNINKNGVRETPK